MKKVDIEVVMTILKEMELVNPPLISDGGGLYSDVHKIGESDLEEIEEKLEESWKENMISKIR